MSVLPQTFHSFQGAIATANTAQVVQSQAGGAGAEPPNSTGAIIKADKGNSAAIYLGDSTVTPATGYMMDAGDIVAIDANGLGKLWVTSGTAAMKFYVLLTGP